MTLPFCWVFVRTHPSTERLTPCRFAATRGLVQSRWAESPLQPQHPKHPAIIISPKGTAKYGFNLWSGAACCVHIWRQAVGLQIKHRPPRPVTTTSNSSFQTQMDLPIYQRTVTHVIEYILMFERTIGQCAI